MITDRRAGSATRIGRLPAGRLLAEFSLWSADLLRLGEALNATRDHADLYHLDVADGHFAPSLLFFPDLVARIRQATDVALHVHLMATNEILLDQVSQFAEAGADLISIHAENGEAIEPALDMLAKRDVAAGLVLKIDTPVEAVAPFLDRLAMVTLLGTAIGVKGQALDPRACSRIADAKRLVAANGARRIILAADGGIRSSTVPELRWAGAETVVMGSLAFEADDLAARMAWLKSLSEGEGR
ncbi:ribulose-phosphate 3-epimerase [Mesorhizobium sp. M0208]|uniref:ribulose-phosphate 3-epimerase n=1 Tax=Mesorhizobium sp. M0208 TaxID=2956916 RepID=UPI0033377A7F